MQRIAVLSVAAASLAFAGSTNGAIIASDAFNYTSGSSLVGANGGTGWAGAYTAGASSGTRSATTNASGQAELTSTSIATNLLFRTLSANQTSGTVYVSFDFQATTMSAYAGLSLYDSGGNEKAVIGPITTAGGNLGRLRIRHSFTDFSTSPSVLATTANTLVLRVDFNASGTNERLRLYANPTDATESLNTVYVDNNTLNFTFNAIRLASASNASQTSRTLFDNIVIADQWADVVPEPSSLAVLALGGLALGRRTRRA